MFGSQFEREERRGVVDVVVSPIIEKKLMNKDRACEVRAGAIAIIPS